MSAPEDICYVYNFDQTDEPRLIVLPTGKGKGLVEDMEDFLDYLKYQIPRQLESESFEIKKGEIVRWYQNGSEDNYSEVEQEAEAFNFAIKSTQGGLVINPIIEGEIIGKEEFDDLTKEQKDDIRQREDQLQDKLITFFHKERVLEKEYKEKMTSLRQNMVRLIINDPLDELRKKYSNNDSLDKYLTGIEDHVLDNFDDFFLFRDIDEEKPEVAKYETPEFREYMVNLLIDNTHAKGAPIVYETNPTFQNIMGYFEYEEKYGSFFTDFHKMKPGALHKANGGFIVIQVIDIIKNFHAWNALKRALRNRIVKLDDLDVDFRVRMNIMPKPEPIPLDVKVILIGDDYYYHMLYNYDDDFKRIFRVKADFSSKVDINVDNTNNLIRFISRVVKEDKLIKFDESAIKEVLFFSSRLADDQKKYLVKATDIVDIIVESNFWAKKELCDNVTAAHVAKAMRKRDDRHSDIRDRYYESIKRDQILLDVKKDEVGQINGLAVYSIGDFSFGIPSRITAKVFAGRRGIVNIDREVNLSGAIHDKGAMILSGYIGSIFAQNKHLAVSASITFEQSYGGVDGDSASSTELYALLSAFSGVPIKQEIAVTGSINQMGDIQPIGGVNEKIEGFFDVCKIKGLSGSQGVIIPIQNVENLNLRDDVIEAVSDAIFTIYAVKNVKEGIEILTGEKAGNMRKDGSFTKDSIYDKVDKKIKELSKVK